MVKCYKSDLKSLEILIQGDKEYANWCMVIEIVHCIAVGVKCYFLFFALRLYLPKMAS